MMNKSYELEQVILKKNILLLQGFVGTFFTIFARFLSKNGCDVFKINFHWGEHVFFHGKNTALYNGGLNVWAQYITNFIKEKNIQQIFLVGAHKVYHEIAIQIAKDFDVDVYVFDEGYIRPNFITLEKDGVNSETNLSKDPEIYLKSDNYAMPCQSTVKINLFKYVCVQWWHYFLYTWLLFFYKFYNPDYIHHIYAVEHKGDNFFKSIFNFIRLSYVTVQMTCIRPFYLKFFNNAWVKSHSQKFYIVALQINTDSAISKHSDVHKSVPQFLDEVLASFAKHAPSDTFLLIKHHPHDLGIHNYRKQIIQMAIKCGIESRIRYIYAAHLPTCFDNAKGCIVINSTLGLSALTQNVPTYATSRLAIYNMKGLTNQCSLDEFWQNLEKPSQKLLSKFLNYLIHHTQLLGRTHGVAKIDFESKFIFK